MTRSSLWSCEDHLLWVQSNGYVERYRRYYYRDIQGFTVQPTLRARHIALAVGLPLLGLLFVSSLALGRIIKIESLIFTVPFAVPLLILFLVNWIKGSTCRTILYTAVSDVVLPSLGRQRAAFRTLQLVAQFVGEVQGPLDANQVGFLIDHDKPAAVARKVSAPQNVVVSLPSGLDVRQLTALPTPRAVNLWLAVLMAIELLQAITATSLVVFGGGAIRQSALCVIIVSSLLIASFALTRGGSTMRGLGLTALGHTVVVGIGCIFAFYAGIFLATFRNRGSFSRFDVSRILDPSLPVVTPVLWVSSLGAFGVVVGCLLVFLRNERQR